MSRELVQSLLNQAERERIQDAIEEIRQSPEILRGENGNRNAQIFLGPESGGIRTALVLDEAELQLIDLTSADGYYRNRRDITLEDLFRDYSPDLIRKEIINKLGLSVSVLYKERRDFEESAENFQGKSDIQRINKISAILG